MDLELQSLVPAEEKLKGGIPGVSTKTLLTDLHSQLRKLNNLLPLLRIKWKKKMPIYNYSWLLNSNVLLFILICRLLCSGSLKLLPADFLNYSGMFSVPPVLSRWTKNNSPKLRTFFFPFTNESSSETLNHRSYYFHNENNKTNKIVKLIKRPINQ